MARKTFEELTADLTIDEIWINRHERCPNGVIGIEWSAPNCGFGQYVMHLGEDGMLHADSEHMDKGDDKRFVKLLLELLLEKIVIED